MAARKTLILLLCLAVLSPASGATNLQAWFAAQADIRAWSADFTQTRTLKALTQPLISQGHLWFAAPNEFRWELGTPAQTIAVRHSNEVLVIYPQLKRAERYSLDNSPNNPMRDMLSLLEAGFPRSQADLEKTFKVLSVTDRDSACHLTLEPKVTAARRWVEKVELSFSTESWSLLSSSLQFADGSSLRNDYREMKKNPRIATVLFSPAIPPEYKIVEPAAPKRSAK
jgi:outer membrane lipoprotein-sorting protein